MAKATLEEDRLKDLLKEAVVEALEEVLEDIALARAIQEGMQTETVSRDEVFKVFESPE
jgi:RelB Antitoxin